MGLDQFTPSSNGDRSSSQPSRWKGTYQGIAEAAYYIWEKEGRPNGRALDHWLRAEDKVRRLVDAGPIRQQNS
jgi:hypothetical protein